MFDVSRSKSPWDEISIQIHQLISLIEGYCSHLRSKAKKVAKSENSPRQPLEVKANVTVLTINKESVHSILADLDKQLSVAESFVPLSVQEFLQPGCSRQQVYNIIQVLKASGMSSRAVHYVYHTGGPKQSLHFVWKIDDQVSEGDLLNKCLNIIRKIEEDAPLYERKITKKEFKHVFGFVTNPVALRAIFRDLTKAILVAILKGIDLRNQSPDVKKDTFRVFFEATEKFLRNEVGVAYHDWRHG